MGYTRQLGQLAYLITFDGSGNIAVPASLTQGSVTSSMLKADAGGKLVAAVAGTDFVAPAGLSAYVPTTRTLTINGTSYDLSADRSWTIVSGVSSFNTRTGAITLTSGDVTTALGYTPVTNARTLTINGTTFDLSADRSWSIVAGLSSFNTRTGAITLLDTDVTGALGYTPVTNARTITINGTTYDLSANRTWVVDTSSVTTRVIQKFTATSSQTTFTITGGYTVGMVDVFLNGIKLDNATEFTASNGSTVVLALGAATGDIVEVYKYGGQFIANNTLRQSTLFTTTAGQTTFTVNYSVGFVDVFYNGSKLDSSEFTATNGTSIVLGTACVLNDKVEVVAYNYTVGAFTGVGGSGTTNTIAKWTASGTLGNSLIFDNGTNVGISNTNPFAGATSLTGLAISDRGGLFKLAVNDVIYLSNNLYYDGANWKRTTANGGTFIQLESVDGGTLRIFGAATGTAGSNATTIDRLMINSSGNMGLGTGNPAIYGGWVGIDVRGGNGGHIIVANTADTNRGEIVTDGNGFNITAVTNNAILFKTNNTERMRVSNGGNLVVGPNGAITTARITSYAGGTILSGTNDGIRLQAFEYSNGSRHTIAWGQDSSNLTLARFGLEWNSGTSQMNFVWRDMYNSAAGTTENMRLTAAGHLQIPNQPAFSVHKKGTANRSGIMTYNTTILNRGNCVNLDNGRFTAPVAGAYQISFMGFQQVATSGILNINLYKNGASFTVRTYQNDPSTEYGPQATMSVVIPLAANDYIYISVDSGEIHGNDDGFFSGYLIG